MARVNVPLTELTPNGSVVSPAGTGADATDGNIVNPNADWPSAKLEEIVVKVANGATDAELTFLAGANPPALEAGLGDLVETVAATTTRYFGPFTSARFAQSDGSLHIDVDNDANVTITAFHVSRSA